MMASPVLSIDSIIENISSCCIIDQDSSSPSTSDTSETVSPTASLNSCSSIGSSGELNTRCELCHNTYVNPKVLSCLHTFCQECIEHNKDDNDKFICPQCQQECTITSKGVLSLLPDFSIQNAVSSPEDSKVYCTSCRNKTTYAVARCFDCHNYLCSHCVTAHQLMHCFEGHRILKLNSTNDNNEDGVILSTDKNILPNESIISCFLHKTEALMYFCRTCNVPICTECTVLDHPAGLHNWEYLSEIGSQLCEVLHHTILESKTRAGEIRNKLKTHEISVGSLKGQYEKAQLEIYDTFKFYKSLLEERREELLKELDGVFSSKQLSLNGFLQKATETVDKIYNACEYCEKLRHQSRYVESLMLKKLIDSKLQLFSKSNIDSNLQSVHDFEFVSNYQAIQVGLKNTFGYVRSSPDSQLVSSKQPPIARPVNIGNPIVNNSSYMNSNSLASGYAISERQLANDYNNCSSQLENNLIASRFTTANSFGPFPTSVRPASALSNNGIQHFDRKPMESDLYKNYSLALTKHEETNRGDTGLKIFTSTLPPVKPIIKRQKMIYHCKFGEYGNLEGQFTEPSGIAVNAQNDLIVADTNSHRVQIFDNEGRFKFQFGEMGKRDGQLLYPNRVAVIKTSGDIIVTERSPTRQVQIYNQYGQFVRKFGSGVLQYPRGVTVDSKGRIIVVECKVMRVVIFDQNGIILKKFGCSKHVEFPNGVVVNDKEEIFISDNRAHCVKVFNYDGVFLRQIGCYGIINYPIGVGINSNGEILIADNHNNFNLTIFTQEGQFIAALESKIKHAQCFDISLMDDGSVVLASKDYRLYIYRYVAIPPAGLD